MAWVAYLPFPGLFALAVLAYPRDRLVRYHAWQGGTLVVLLYAWLTLWGLAAAPAPAGAQEAMGVAAGAGLLLAAFGLAWGGVSAARGRYPRIRPVWDLLAAIGR